MYVWLNGIVVRILQQSDGGRPRRVSTGSGPRSCQCSYQGATPATPEQRPIHRHAEPAQRPPTARRSPAAISSCRRWCSSGPAVGRPWSFPNAAGARSRPGSAWPYTGLGSPFGGDPPTPTAASAAEPVRATRYPPTATSSKTDQPSPRPNDAVSRSKSSYARQTRYPSAGRKPYRARWISWTAKLTAAPPTGSSNLGSEPSYQPQLRGPKCECRPFRKRQPWRAGTGAALWTRE